MREKLAFEKGITMQNLRRRLISSFMDLLIIKELTRKDLSGYDIVRIIRDRFHVLMGTGSVYTLLYRLEREGIIKSFWNGKRRLYSLTNKGDTIAKTTLKFYYKIEQFISSHLILEEKALKHPA